ncbi:MAG: hypothetical protein ACI4NO_06375 [Oxalobacter sp.]
MEVFLVFIAYSVFIFGGCIMVQLYLLRKKRVDTDRTREALERMLVRDCDNAISRCRMQFSRVPKKDIGYLTQVTLTHEANMPEFYIAFADAGERVLGYARFLRREGQGHKMKYTLSGIVPADTVPAPYPVLFLNNELFTLNDAVKTNDVIDSRMDKLIQIRTAMANA